MTAHRTTSYRHRRRATAAAALAAAALLLGACGGQPDNPAGADGAAAPAEDGAFTYGGEPFDADAALAAVETEFAEDSTDARLGDGASCWLVVQPDSTEVDGSALCGPVRDRGWQEGDGYYDRYLLAVTAAGGGTVGAIEVATDPPQPEEGLTGVDVTQLRRPDGTTAPDPTGVALDPPALDPGGAAVEGGGSGGTCTADPLSGEEPDPRCDTREEIELVGGLYLVVWEREEPDVASLSSGGTVVAAEGERLFRAVIDTEFDPESAAIEPRDLPSELLDYPPELLQPEPPPSVESAELLVGGEPVDLGGRGLDLYGGSVTVVVSAPDGAAVEVSVTTDGETATVPLRASGG